MGRAIVRQPQAFLMDEPLSNLDAKLRVQMRAEIARLQHDLGVTTIYVTHDQVEAMTMGDRVAVMRKGELQQVAAPQELYDRPVNLFVGGFIGSPAMNLLEATLERRHGTPRRELGDQRIALRRGRSTRRPALQAYAGRDVDRRHPARGPRGRRARRRRADGRRLEGEVQLREALGSEIMVHLDDRRARRPRTEEVRELAEDVGERRAPATAQARGDASSAASTPRSRVQGGRHGRGRRRHARLHFFDPETGLGHLRRRRSRSTT